MSRRFLVTCEHASNAVPPEFRRLFRGRKTPLQSHRAWDPGAEESAVALARRLAAPLLVGRFTRLVVDLNRTITTEAAFSEITCALPASERAEIAARWWAPMRDEAETIALRPDGSPVLHISVHTFTPVLDGKTRDMHVAWLYDPRRRAETAVVGAWMRAFRKRRPELRLARNRPYKGTDDGHTTHLRTLLPGERYAGIELEVNHGLLREGARRWSGLCADAAESLAEALGLP